MSWWVPLLASLIGGGIAGTASYIGVVLTQQKQIAMDVARDARALRDARITRLRAAFLEALNAAMMVQAIAIDSSYIRDMNYDQSIAWLTELKNKYLEKTTGVNRALVGLRLETDVKSVTAASAEVSKAYRVYQDLVDKRLHRDPEASDENLMEVLRRIYAAVDKLEDEAHTAITQLERPIEVEEVTFWSIFRRGERRSLQ